jgi:hypothetical protein
VQGRNFSWLGYPENTPDDARSILPGLGTEILGDQQQGVALSPSLGPDAAASDGHVQLAAHSDPSVARAVAPDGSAAQHAGGNNAWTPSRPREGLTSQTVELCGAADLLEGLWARPSAVKALLEPLLAGQATPSITSVPQPSSSPPDGSLVHSEVCRGPLAGPHTLATVPRCKAARPSAPLASLTAAQHSQPMRSGGAGSSNVGGNAKDSAAALAEASAVETLPPPVTLGGITLRNAALRVFVLGEAF